MFFETPVEVLPGTSPLTIKHLKSVGVMTYGDMVSYYPFRYENYSLVSPISRLQEGETVTVKGLILRAKNEYTRRGFKLQKVSLSDETGTVDVTWINQPYLMHVFKPGLHLSVAGTVVRFGSRISIQPKEWEVLRTNHIHTGRIIPVYSEVRGLSTKTIREKMFHVISGMKQSPALNEKLPADIIREQNLFTLQEALIQIHFPDNAQLLDRARERLGFDELLRLQLASLLTKREWDEKKASYVFKTDNGIGRKIEDFTAHLPFELTNDQKRAVNEILKDLGKSRPMNRFLQGDVGSGKTVVAAVAAYSSYLNGCRTLIMAPTEILALQHYETLRKLFANTGLNIGIRTGSKKERVEEAAHITVGTHALLTKSAVFDKVGLIIIDEQHRFGVAQRALLKEKGLEPHLLTMTATPIPRTLALTLYGELDLSVISQMPKGRVPVKSYLVPDHKREAAYEWIRTKVKSEKTQVFIICPLIEESDVETMMTMKAAKKEYEHLKNEVFPDLTVSLLHGRMKPGEKEKVMNDFAAGKSDILVSTSVVEVGIDIPNASIMLIEGAQKFGMAQLHQLRGRVGRGSVQSYCYLFANGQDEAAVGRLAYFASHTNGAELAEYDLHNRGPGNIFGTSQSGYMKLKIAKLSDIPLIKRARVAAEKIMGESPDLEAFPELKMEVSAFYTPEVARD